MSEMKVSVIVPCYNEEAVLERGYQRIKDVLDQMEGEVHEIVFVDDGSSDGTMRILEEIAGKDADVKVISFSRNFGHQPAVSAGITSCSGDVAVIIDADMQDPPELIRDMIAVRDKENCHVVYGVRKKRRGESFFKKITSKIFYRLINFLSDVPIPLDTGDFRLIDRTVINEFKNLSEKNKFIRGLISWIGFKQVPFHYTRDPRLAGETKYPLVKMVKFATTGLLYFSKKPLKLAISLGFLNIVVGLALILYAVIGKIFNLIETVPGWASLLVAVIFFGGVQLMTIGVLGEYIGSIFDEIKERPEYIISRKINL
jgi:glycosyltransferase involved in cell wall biosynthesis